MVIDDYHVSLGTEVSTNDFSTLKLDSNMKKYDLHDVENAKRLLDKSAADRARAPHNHEYLMEAVRQKRASRSDYRKRALRAHIPTETDLSEQMTF